jgi:ADP-heptose:LPS heptosyltransferase
MALNDRLKVLYLTLVYGFRERAIGLLQRFLFVSYSTPSRIVIHRVAAFGDAVVSLPAIALIRAKFPDAEIDLVSTSTQGITIADVLQGSDVVDQIYLFKKHERAAALRQIRAHGYDLYVELPQNLNLYKSLRNMLLVRFYLKIPSAFGWDRGRLKRFARTQVDYMSIPREIDRFRLMLEKNGIEGTVEFPIAAYDSDREYIDKLIGEDGKRPLIGFLIGGKLAQKKWPLQNWARLAARWGSQFDFCLIGGPGEIEEAEAIRNTVPAVRNFCGRTSILQTAELLRRCTAVVSLDTGAMHLAYAVGTPVVALFSTRDITNKWRPYGVNNITIEKRVDCSYCFSKHCADNICMKRISVDEVAAALSELVSKSSSVRKEGSRV